MNIQHLNYILEVARAGSISQAAENLYMGQPNLSKAIKELEQTLNITIFRRTPKGVEVTPKGREFIRHAKSILQQYEALEALGRDEEEATQRLRVSVPRASYIVEAFTTFLAKLDPERPIKVDFLETNALRAVRHVADGRSDFGIIRCRTDYQDYIVSLLRDNALSWRVALEFRYLLLISRSHPLATASRIDEEALRPYIEIIHGDTALPHMPQNVTETERGQTAGDKKVYVYERGSMFDMLARVPGTYMWVSPMPDDLLRRNGLVQKQSVASPYFNDIVIYQSGHTFRRPEELFLTELEQTVEGILRSIPET